MTTDPQPTIATSPADAGGTTPTQLSLADGDPGQTETHQPASTALGRPITLKPGYLVTLSTSVKGGVVYEKTDEKRDKLPSGTVEERWKTLKVTADEEEHDAAVKVRGRVRSMIEAACTWTPFGLVCAHEDLNELDQAIVKAERLVEEFNSGAETCEVRFSSLRGQIAEDSAEAVRAVRQEITQLVDDMEGAILGGDIRSIRDLATKAKKMNQMLPEGTAGEDALGRAVKAARRVAKALVKRVDKGGEDVAAVLEEAEMSPIAEAKGLFLDLEDEAVEGEAVEPEEAAAPGWSEEPHAAGDGLALSGEEFVLGLDDEEQEGAEATTEEE